MVKQESNETAKIRRHFVIGYSSQWSKLLEEANQPPRRLLLLRPHPWGRVKPRICHAARNNMRPHAVELFDRLKASPPSLSVRTVHSATDNFRPATIVTFVSSSDLTRRIIITLSIILIIWNLFLCSKQGDLNYRSLQVWLSHRHRNPWLKRDAYSDTLMISLLETDDSHPFIKVNPEGSNQLAPNMMLVVSDLISGGRCLSLLHNNAAITHVRP